MRVWTVEEMPEKFDDLLDAAEWSGPQLIVYGGKPMIMVTKEDYEDHLAGKTLR
jgi:hypothetical protein